MELDVENNQGRFCIQDDDVSHILCVGPLNLNKATKRADTSYNKRLAISEKEFDALLLLALRPGEPVTLDEILRVVWGKDIFQEQIAQAKQCLENLVQQTNENGECFMRIEQMPKDVYTLKFQWGKNMVRAS